MFDHRFPNFLGLIRKNKIILKNFSPLRVTKIKANQLGCQSPQILSAGSGGKHPQNGHFNLGRTLQEKFSDTALGVRWCQCLLWCFIKCPLEQVRQRETAGKPQGKAKIKFLVRNTGGFSKQAVLDGATGKFSICPCFMEAAKWGELIPVKEFRGLQIQFSFAGSCMKLGKSLFLSWSNSQGLISSLSSCVPIAKTMRIFETKLQPKGLWTEGKWNMCTSLM